MSRIIGFLAAINDGDRIEEMNDIAEHMGIEAHNIDAIYEAPKNMEVRGIRTDELIDHIIQQTTDDGETEYHSIYNDGYIEWQMSPTTLDSEYRIVVTTAVQVYPSVL